VPHKYSTIALTSASDPLIHLNIIKL